MAAGKPLPTTSPRYMPMKAIRQAEEVDKIASDFGEGYGAERDLDGLVAEPLGGQQRGLNQLRLACLIIRNASTRGTRSCGLRSRHTPRLRHSRKHTPGCRSARLWSGISLDSRIGVEAPLQVAFCRNAGRPASRLVSLGSGRLVFRRFSANCSLAGREIDL